MKIPSDALARESLYRELTEACLSSRSDRIGDYERRRSYYLWGCDGSGNPATFNKILPQMELLVSFLFAAETTRFGIIVGESAKNDKEISKVPALTKRLNTKWQDSNADVQFGQGVTWSLVYNSMFMKLIQRGKSTIPYLIDPHSFGVLDEGMPFLDDQEAFVHTYSVSKRSLDRILKDHPRKDEIIANASASPKKLEHELPEGLQRIVMSQFPMTGSVNGPGQISGMFNTMNTYRAKTLDECIEMRELWVWNDDTNDYQVVTMASGGICVYDRENIYLPGEHPFMQICPNPSYDYFYGHSEVERLMNLQDCREKRMGQIADLLDRQVKPPTTQKGQWQGIPDETNFAMQVFGAGISSSDPMADVKVWAPTIPQDTYAEIREIDNMFNEMTGLSNVTQGKGESGVRSKGHASELARLGSSRIRKRAFTLEDGLDKIGLHYMKLMQQHDSDSMRDDKGQLFIAEQFTKDYTVKVDGHSSSPIFTEEYKSMAETLFSAKAIDREELIEMLDPPGRQVMIEKLKKIEAAEAAAAKAQQQAEAKKG